MSFLSLQTQKLPTSSDAATKSAHALDPESDTIPDQFKCPICLDLFRQEIYQCPNGHTICKKCWLNVINRSRCTQCRSGMRAEDSTVIRCRAMEELMDQLLIACPHRSRGCLVTMSRRGDMKLHAQGCVYDGNCLQLCHHLGFQEKCDFWSKTLLPQQILGHLVNQHHATSLWGTDATMILSDFRGILKLSLFSEIKKPVPIGMWAPFHLTSGENNYLIVTLFNQYDRSLSFVALRINNKQKGEQKEQKNEREIEFRIKAQSAEVTDLKWKIPAIFVLKPEAKTMLRHPPFRVSVDILDKYYMGKQTALNVKVIVGKLKNLCCDCEDDD